MLLEVKNLDNGYGFLQVLWDVSLYVQSGEFVCLIGPNGAGKSTTLKSIAGILKPKRGLIRFQGETITGLEGHHVFRKGVSYISEELNLFTGMSVYENLAMGAFALKDKKQEKERFGFVFNLFKILSERRNQLAGTLSGGERKMLAIARGVMSNPNLLLIDEPSLGLAPRVGSEVFKFLEVLHNNGVTILLVEQNVRRTLQFCNRGYVLENGRIVVQGTNSDLESNEHVKRIYIGIR